MFWSQRKKTLPSEALHHVLMMLIPTKEIISCHYDVHPYRDAFYRRNSPCYLLCCSFLIVLLLTILSGLLFTSSSDNIDPGLSDNFVTNLASLFKLDRTTIVTDTKEIYPSDLKFSISPHKITANKPFPICIKAPKFLMPLLQTPTNNALNQKKHASSNIDEIKKAHENLEEDMFKKRAKNWLKAPAFFKDDQNSKLQDLEDDPLLDIKIEEMWQSFIGYRLDPECFIRIDPSSSKILKRLERDNVDLSTHQNIICSDTNVM